eukprot:4899468-Pyramimonas_sp.AAC.1
MFVGGLSGEASWGPLGCSFEASDGPSWGLLGALWVSWGPLRSLLGPLGRLSGASWASGADFRFVFPHLGPFWGCLGAILGASWAVLLRP